MQRAVYLWMSLKGKLTVLLRICPDILLLKSQKSWEKKKMSFPVKERDEFVCWTVSWTVALHVDLCRFFQTEKRVSHLYRCVLCCESMCVSWRGSCFFYVSLSVDHLSLWHVSPSNCKALMYEVLNVASIFTRHCCILWEFIFCPLTEADAGTKLVSVLSRPHNEAYWVICTFDSAAGEMRRVIYFF